MSDDYYWPPRSRPGTFTPAWRLYQPKVGEIGWGQDVDLNFKIIDDHLGNKISETRDILLTPELGKDHIIICSPDLEGNNWWTNKLLTLDLLNDVNIDLLNIEHGWIIRWSKPSEESIGEWKAYPYMEGWDLTTIAEEGDVWIYTKDNPHDPNPDAPRKWKPVSGPFIRQDGSRKMQAILNMGGDASNSEITTRHRIVNLADPIDEYDAVNKKYMSAHASKYWKDSVKGFFNPNSYIDLHPPDPVEGDRYIANTTYDDGGQVAIRKNAIYTYKNEEWVEEYPELGTAVYVESDKCPFTFNDEINDIDPTTSPAGGTFWSPMKGSGGGSGVSGDYVRKAYPDQITAKHTFATGDNPPFVLDGDAKTYSIFRKNTVEGLSAERWDGISSALLSWGHVHLDDPANPVYPWGAPPSSDYIETARDLVTGSTIVGFKGVDADKLDGLHLNEVVDLIRGDLGDWWVRKTEYNYLHLMALLMVPENQALWQPGGGEFGSGKNGFTAQFLYDDTDGTSLHASSILKKTDLINHRTNIDPESLRLDDHIQYLPITSDRAQRHGVFDINGQPLEGTILCTNLYMDGQKVGDTILLGGLKKSIYGLKTPTSGDPLKQDLYSTSAATKGYVDQMALGISWIEPIVCMVDTPPDTPTHGDRFVIHAMKEISDPTHPTQIIWAGHPKIWSNLTTIPETYTDPNDNQVKANPFFGYEARLAIFDETLNSGDGGWIISDTAPALNSAVYADLTKEQYVYNDTDNEWYIFSKLGSHQDLTDRSHPDAHLQYLNNIVPTRAIMRTNLTMTHYEYGGSDAEGNDIYLPYEWNISNLKDPRYVPLQNAVTNIVSGSESDDFYSYKKHPAHVTRGIGYYHNQDAISKSWVEKRLPNNVLSSHSAARYEKRYRAVYDTELPSNPKDGDRALVAPIGTDWYLAGRPCLASSMPDCIMEWHYTGIPIENHPWSGGWWYEYTPERGYTTYIQNDSTKPDGEYLIFDDNYAATVKEWVKTSTTKWCPNEKHIGNVTICREPIGGQWENLGVAVRHEVLRNARLWKYELRHNITTPIFTIKAFYTPTDLNGGYPEFVSDGERYVPIRNYPTIGDPVVKKNNIYHYNSGEWIEIEPSVGDVIHCAGNGKNYKYSASLNEQDVGDVAFNTNWWITTRTALYRRKFVDYDPSHPETYDNIGIDYLRAYVQGGTNEPDRNPDQISIDHHHQYMRVDGARHEVRHHKYPIGHNPYLNKSNFPLNADPFDDQLKLPSYKEYSRYAGYEGDPAHPDNVDYFSVPHDSIRWLDDVYLAEQETGGVDRFGRKPLAVSHLHTLVYWNNPSDPLDPLNKKWINYSPPQGVQHHYQFAKSEREDHPLETNLQEFEKISHHQYVRVNLDGIVPIYPSEEYTNQDGYTTESFQNAKVVDFSTLWINEWNKIFNNGAGGSNIYNLRYGGDRGDDKALTYTTKGVTRGERNDGHKATGIHRVLPVLIDNDHAWAWGDAYYGYTPHDRVEGLVNVWSRPDYVPIAYMDLPLDLGGRYYYRDLSGHESVLTGQQLIDMGHTIGGGTLIDPTGIHHYDSRIDGYILRLNINPDGSGIWANVPPTAAQVPAEHDALNHRLEHSNHPHYLESCVHNATYSYNADTGSLGVRTWYDHNGIQRSGKDWIKFLNPAYNEEEEFAYIHNLGPKYDAAGNPMGGPAGNIPHDFVAGLRDVMLYGRSTHICPYYAAPLQFEIDPNDPTPPDTSTFYGNALGEGHVLQYHNGKWTNIFNPGNREHDQLLNRELLNAHPQYVGYKEHHATISNTDGSYLASLNDLHAYYSDYIYKRDDYGDTILTPQGYTGDDACNGYYVINGNLPHDFMYRGREVSLGNPNGLHVGSLPTSPADPKACKNCGYINEGADPESPWTCTSCSTVNNPGDILPPSITKHGYFLSFKWVPFVDGLGKVYYKHRIILTNSVALPPGFTVDHINLTGLTPTVAGWATENHKIYEGDHHPQYLGTLSGWEKKCYAIHTFMGNQEDPIPFRVNVSASNMVENLCAHYLGDSSATGGKRIASDFALTGHTHSLIGSSDDAHITDVKIDTDTLIKNQVLAYIEDPANPGNCYWSNLSLNLLKPKFNDLLDVDVEDRRYFLSNKMRRFASDPNGNNYAAGSIMVFGDPHLDGERERENNANNTTMWQPLLPPDPTAIPVNTAYTLQYSLYDDGSGAIRPWIRWGVAGSGGTGTGSSLLSEMLDVVPTVATAPQYSLFYKGPAGKWTSFGKAFSDGDIATPENVTRKTKTLVSKLIVPDEGDAYMSMVWGQSRLEYLEDVAQMDLSTLRSGTLLMLDTSEETPVWAPFQTPETSENYTRKLLSTSYDGENIITEWTNIPHDDTTGLQGGESGQYYHLNANQHNTLTGSTDCNIHHHDSRYYTKSNLISPTSKSYIHWNNIVQMNTSAGTVENRFRNGKLIVLDAYNQPVGWFQQSSEPASGNFSKTVEVLSGKSEARDYNILHMKVSHKDTGNASPTTHRIALCQDMVNLAGIESNARKVYFDLKSLVACTTATGKGITVGLKAVFNNGTDYEVNVNVQSFGVINTTNASGVYATQTIPVPSAITEDIITVKIVAEVTVAGSATPTHVAEGFGEYWIKDIRTYQIATEEIVHQIRTDESLSFVRGDPILMRGEISCEYDPTGVPKIKVGDGDRKYSELPSISGSGGGMGDVPAGTRDGALAIWYNNAWHFAEPPALPTQGTPGTISEDFVFTMKRDTIATTNVQTGQIVQTVEVTPIWKKVIDGGDFSG